ncbi:MAG: hypothetical protein ACRCTA_02200 [Bacilli bacterium]
MIKWEIKLHLKKSIIYTIVTLTFVMMSFIKYTTFNNDMLSEIINAMPRSLQIILGFANYQVTNPLLSYLNMVYYYAGIIISLYSINLAYSLKNSDYLLKIIDFTYTRPRPYHKIKQAKYYAGLINIILINLILMISTLIIIITYQGNINDLMCNVTLLLSSILIYTLSFLITKQNIMYLIYLSSFIINLGVSFSMIPYLNIINLTNYFTKVDMMFILNLIVLLVVILSNYISLNKPRDFDLS